MNKKSIVVFGIVALSMCALPAFAYGPFAGRYQGDCRYDRPGPCADLTAEQQAQLRELRQDFRDRTQGLREDLWAKRQEMRTILGGSSPDEKQLKKVQKVINALQAKLADAKVEHMLEVKKINPQAFTGEGFGYGRHAGKCGWRPCPSGYGQGRNFSGTL